MLAELKSKIGSVRLIAVSKKQSPESIRGLYAQGQRVFGENYVQELQEKAQALADLPDLHWVYIGVLQSNKIKRVAQWAQEVQTLSSPREASLLAQSLRGYGKTQLPVYICVNLGDEPQKGGVDLQGVPDLARFIQESCPELALQGLMAIPPQAMSDEAHRTGKPPEAYLRLRELAKVTGAGKLSLGMSSDYEAAILAGATDIRIGTALFGKRPYT